MVVVVETMCRVATVVGVGGGTTVCVVGGLVKAVGSVVSVVAGRPATWTTWAVGVPASETRAATIARRVATASSLATGAGGSRATYRRRAVSMARLAVTRRTQPSTHGNASMRSQLA